MKISPETINILKNFSSINKNIAIYAGENTIQTISDSESEFAIAKINEDFPFDIALNDLGEFLNVTNLFNDPEYILTNNSITIREDGSKRGGICLKYASLHHLIVVEKGKKWNAPDDCIKIDVPWEKLNQIIKTASVLGLPNIQFNINHEGATAKIYNKLYPDGSKEGNIILSNDTFNDNIELCFDASKFKMLSNVSYELHIYDAGFVRWSAVDGNYDYIMAAESD